MTNPLHGRFPNNGGRDLPRLSAVMIAHALDGNIPGIDRDEANGRTILRNSSQQSDLQYSSEVMARMMICEQFKTRQVAMQAAAAIREICVKFELDPEAVSALVRDRAQWVALQEARLEARGSGE